MNPLDLVGNALIHLLAISHLCGVKGVALPASLGDAISKIAKLAAEDKLYEVESLLKNLGKDVEDLPDEIMAHVEALVDKPAPKAVIPAAVSLNPLK